MHAKLLGLVGSALLLLGCAQRGSGSGAAPAAHDAESGGTGEATAPHSFDLKAIGEWVKSRVKDPGVVGLSLAILRDGEIVFSQGYGQASLDPPAPVGADTSFGIGSVTKQFTCAGALLLAEEGKLAMTDKVAKYYPDLTRAGDITLLDLGSHVSGYPDYYPLDFVDRRLLQPIALDRLIHEYAGGKLDFDPGTRWSYSNTGFTILGRVVEKVSGEPFGAFLSRRVLMPLGMVHSAFEPPRDGKGRARGYTSFALGPPEPAVPEAAGWLYAVGGLYASAPDLLRWDLALMDGKVLKPASLALMTSPRRLANGRMTDYGCGLGISRQQGETVLRHEGAVSGFLAYNAMVPRTRSAVVLLVNSEAADLRPLHDEVLALLLRAQRGLPRVQGPPPAEVALGLLHQMQAAAVDRRLLGDALSVYLSDERLRQAAARLKALGEPRKVDVEGIRERGGMEVATIRFRFKASVVEALLYRTPDGKVQEFLLYKV